MPQVQRHRGPRRSEFQAQPQPVQRSEVLPAQVRQPSLVLTERMLQERMLQAPGLQAPGLQEPGLQEPEQRE